MIFQTNKNEEVKLMIRRHWANLLGLISFVLIMSILPIIFYFILSPYIHLSDGFFNVFVIGLGMYYMFIATLFFIGWLDYYLDVWIITNHRVIDSEQHGFFKRSVAELHLSKIQDISIIVSGPIATFLDYGDLEIQTAGTEPKFIFKQIPHPVQVKDQIMRAHNQFVTTHPNDVEIHEEKQPTT